MNKDIFNHITTLIAGDNDWSGHNKTCSWTVWTNLTGEQLYDAYHTAAAKYGLDLLSECRFNVYLSLRFVQKLKDLGLCESLVKDHLAYYADSVEHYFDGIECDDFPDLYLLIARLAEPKLEWQYLGSNYVELHGYGLFSA
jgi:hypothetical protein